MVAVAQLSLTRVCNEKHFIEGRCRTLTTTEHQVTEAKHITRREVSKAPHCIERDGLQPMRRDTVLLEQLPL